MEFGKQRLRNNFLSRAILSHWRLFKDADLLCIRLKYARRYRGLRIVAVFAILAVMAFCVLLMAKVHQDKLWPDENLLIRFSEYNGSGPISVSNAGKTTWTKSYNVQFAPGAKLVVVAELHHVDKPVRPLGRKIFTGSTDPQRFAVSFTRAYKDKAKTIVGHSTKVQLSEQALEIPEFTVGTDRYLEGEVLRWFQSGELRKLHQPHTKKDETTLTSLFSYRLEDRKAKRRTWVPGPGISSGVNHRIVLNMIPASRLKHLVAEPIGGFTERSSNKISVGSGVRVGNFWKQNQKTENSSL